MANDEYEIVPHKDILDLKKEIARLKGEGQTPDTRDSLFYAVTKLNDSINDLLKLFKAASESMAAEGEVADMSGVNEKLNTIIEQNKKIAEGIVALADLIKAGKAQAPAMPRPIMPEPRPLPSFKPFEMPEIPAIEEPPTPPPGPMPPPGPLKRR